MYPAAAVANAMQAKAAAEGRPLTHMQLQKLVYIAHGWHMAVTGRPLIRETVEAWKYGPVIPDLYDQLKSFGGAPVTDPVPWWDYDAGLERVSPPTFPTDTRDVLDRVWAAYKHLNGLQLSTLTHQKGTPWYQVAGELPARQRRRRPISDGAIHAHYVELAGKD
jgi:uncharacterized phage-associated protein